MSPADTLRRRLAEDADAAFPALVAAYGDALYGTALRLTGSRDDAADLAQDTLIRAYRALAGYEAERIRALQLRGWLWTILLNLVRSRARQRSRKPPPADLDAVAEPRAPGDQAASTAAALTLAAALRELPPAQSEAIVLRYVADLGFADVAAATGHPVGTVKSHVHRGLVRLREILREESP